MANLAIKGHRIQGDKVIKLLEMLGGKNNNNYLGNNVLWVYYINKEGCIITDFDLNRFSVFTLEEFLEKYPYKVGDKVSSKYLKNYKIEKMEWEDTNNRVIYKLQGMGWYIADELQPYKAEIMEKEISGAIIDRFICLEGYDFYDDKGNIINTKEITMKKKQPKYPKTYEECCDVLQMPKDESYIDIDVPLSYNKVLTSFTQLLICRDAYWKIAGDWEPNFANVDEKFIIACYYGKIYTTIATNYNRVLVFPTEEMRDAFYENFNELIEECKELL